MGEVRMNGEGRGKLLLVAISFPRAQTSRSRELAGRSSHPINRELWTIVNWLPFRLSHVRLLITVYSLQLDLMVCFAAKFFSRIHVAVCEIVEAWKIGKFVVYSQNFHLFATLAENSTVLTNFSQDPPASLRGNDMKILERNSRISPTFIIAFIFSLSCRSSG